METMSIGPAPTEENCAQLGRTDYGTRSRIECAVFMRMLERQFPVPDGVPAYLSIESFPNEDDSYREVCARYDESSELAMAYALQLEVEIPTEWDEIARQELKANALLP
jgi:hypothetical protein